MVIAARHEQARCVADVLLRRTRLGILAAPQLRDGDAARPVAEAIGAELGWSRRAGQAARPRPGRRPPPRRASTPPGRPPVVNNLPPDDKTELESKHLSELHQLAAEAGVERYRMLPRAELIEKLAGGESGSAAAPGRAAGARRREEESGRRAAARAVAANGGRGERESARPRGARRRGRAAPSPSRRPSPRRSRSAPKPEPAARAEGEASRPKRRRRRRFGRGRKGLPSRSCCCRPSRPPGAPLAESRAACTAMLRGVAADLAGASDGPDPVVLLIDPSPEELADWRREAPQAEIVAAGQARHADDALAQAGAPRRGRRRRDPPGRLADPLRRVLRRRRRRQGSSSTPAARRRGSAAP